MTVIGIDPHKGSHTAVAIGAAEGPLGGLRVRACVAQAQKLLTWAAWPGRTWPPTPPCPSRSRAAFQGPAPGDGRGLRRSAEGVVQAAP